MITENSLISVTFFTIIYPIPQLNLIFLLIIDEISRIAITLDSSKQLQWSLYTVRGQYTFARGQDASTMNKWRSVTVMHGRYYIT